MLGAYFAQNLKKYKPASSNVFLGILVQFWILISRTGIYLLDRLSHKKVCQITEGWPGQLKICRVKAEAFRGIPIEQTQIESTS